MKSARARRDAPALHTAASVHYGRDHGLGIRALAAKHRVHRRTVRHALASAVPPARKEPDRDAPALGRWKAVIDAILEADRSAPRMQRHTAQRIWQRLTDEHGATVAESHAEGPDGLHTAESPKRPAKARRISPASRWPAPP